MQNYLRTPALRANLIIQDLAHDDSVPGLGRQGWDRSQSHPGEPSQSLSGRRTHSQ